MHKSFKHRYGPYWQAYVFLLVPIAYIVVFKYVPMLGVQIAFKKYSLRLGIWESPWVGFQHFQNFFNSHMFERTVGNTLRLSVYSVLAGFPFPILFAWGSTPFEAQG